MECACYFIPGGRHMECACYFIPGGRHMECATYFIPGGRHMECATYVDFLRLCHDLPNEECNYDFFGT